MTNAEEAEMRGEIYALKILLINCLGFIAAITDDPGSHLQAVQDQSIEGIARSRHGKVKAAYLRNFQDAAAGIVLQAIEGAKVASAQVEKPERLQ